MSSVHSVDHAPKPIEIICLPLLDIFTINIAGQRDTTKNHGRLGGIRQTPGYLQKQPCHLPEETGVQRLCTASYGIWCRYLNTDQTSTEQTSGRTDQNGKKYAQHHIQR